MHRQHKQILIVALLLLAGVTHAQSISGSQPPPVQYIVAPETPGPNQLVTIEVQGVGTFLGNSTLTWRQNGKTVSSGIGQETYSFTTGGIGTQTVIHLAIDSAAQGLITHDFFFYPSIINLIWEADTSVPLLYGGKPLYSAGSSVRVSAFPLVVSGGTLVSAQKISYQWFRGGNSVPAQSGLGKTTLSFEGDQLQSNEDVSVDAYLGATKVGHAEISIPATNPEVVFYDREALRGEILDKALTGSISLNAQEMTVQAEPYFFANSSKRNGTLSYAWTLNGQAADGPDASQGMLTLRQTGSGVGAAQVGVSVQNTDNSKYVQAAAGALQIVFGQQSGVLQSFFGL